MAIQFHCEHCGESVAAPDDTGGTRGKCPHCQRKIYIPMPEEEESGELPLAPLDQEDERRRLEARREATRLQQELLQEQSAPGEPKKPRRDGLSATGAKNVPVALPAKELNRLIVQFVEAMGGGNLDQADKLAAKLSPHKSQATILLNTMSSEELSAYGLPVLPRPVLMGFLSQLRMKLQGRSG